MKSLISCIRHISVLETTLIFYRFVLHVLRDSIQVV